METRFIFLIILTSLITVLAKKIAKKALFGLKSCAKLPQWKIRLKDPHCYVLVLKWELDAKILPQLFCSFGNLCEKITKNSYFWLFFTFFCKILKTFSNQISAHYFKSDLDTRCIFTDHLDLINNCFGPKIAKNSTSWV